jgi:hypothetical protein
MLSSTSPSVAVLHDSHLTDRQHAADLWLREDIREINRRIDLLAGKVYELMGEKH